MLKKLGAILLVASLTICLLFIVEIPSYGGQVLFYNQVTVPPHGKPINFCNLTLSCEGREDYHVFAEISFFQDKPFILDLWVVNETGYGLLNDFLSYGEIFKEDYPDNRPFNLIVTYAKEINLTSPRKIEITDFENNVPCCFVLLNFFDDPQSVMVKVEDYYFTGVKPVLEATPITIILVTITFSIGLYLTVFQKNSKRRRHRIKKLKNRKMGKAI